MEFNQKLLFVTGKGGTGKSVLASILAVRFANENKKVLLIDAEAAGGIAQQFEHAPVGYQPVEVARNIYVLQTNTDDALSEYLRLYAKIPSWAKITPLARLIDLVSHAAPGVQEILVTGKICYETKKIIENESEYDLVIVDAPSSGHVLSLLDAPRALSELVSRGMIQAQTQWMQDIIHNGETTGVVVVTTTDDVVLSETHELISDIETNTNVAIAGIVINKDMADLGTQQTDLEFVPSSSDLIDRASRYYMALIKQTREAAHTLDDYPLFVFPFLTNLSPALRTLMKNAERFAPVVRSES
ncbi:MAG TPA: ArsA-related P-loop ATPase [Acidimicrobiia bacterium]|nr:ArsA-related P-loop ATPase [Acidimicrobiia bacterium]